MCHCCFPGCTLVVTKKSGLKRLDELKIGEQLQTLGKKEQKWTRFYTWGDVEREFAAEFIRFKFGQENDGLELTMTAEHMLFVADNDGKNKIVKKAGQVCIGDKLFHQSASGDMELLPIAEIGLVEIRGIYAPFTTSGTFLANGFLVGCYGNVESFSLAHSVFAPLRVWYKMSKENNNDAKDGIHAYAKNLMKIRDNLPSSLQAKVM